MAPAALSFYTELMICAVSGAGSRGSCWMSDFEEYFKWSEASTPRMCWFSCANISNAANVAPFIVAIDAKLDETKPLKRSLYTEGAPRCVGKAKKKGKFASFRPNFS